MPRVIAATRLAALVGDFDRDPAYAGLAARVAELVTEGRVPVGVRLPSERELTAALGVSRTTVARAYAALRDDGFVVSRQGSGSVTVLPPGRGHRGDHLLSPVDAGDGVIDLTCAAAAPAPGVLAAYGRAAEALPAHMAGTGYFPSGLPALREAVARDYASRGLATSPEQVVVVPGALAGVAVAARALLGSGDRVVVENPTYPNAIATLVRSGGRLLGADPDVESLVTTLRQVLPRAAYLIPDFHNPTGRLLEDDERERLAATLRRTRTTAVVDESMAPLVLDGRTMPAPMAAHAPGAVSVGSTSKPWWGGLRVGWVRVPEHLLDAVVASRLSLDLGAPVLEQLVAADLVGQGEAGLAERRTALRASRDAARAALLELLPDWEVADPAGGLSLWCRLPAPRSTTLVARALHHGVALAPGPAFAPEGGLERHLRIPFALPPDVVVEAVSRVAAAWRDVRDGVPAGPGAPSPTLVA
ncbi:MocR-like transcription factor YczR [Nocardioides marmoraquaticus]